MASNEVKDFVKEKFDHMFHRPAMYALTKDVFIVQLVLLAEVSWIGVTRSDASSLSPTNYLMRELCGKESGCIVPRDEITDEWAKERVDIARRHSNI